MRNKVAEVYVLLQWEFIGDGHAEKAMGFEGLVCLILMREMCFIAWRGIAALVFYGRYYQRLIKRSFYLSTQSFIVSMYNCKYFFMIKRYAPKMLKEIIF